MSFAGTHNDRSGKDLSPDTLPKNEILPYTGVVVYKFFLIGYYFYAFQGIFVPF